MKVLTLVLFLLSLGGPMSVAATQKEISVLTFNVGWLRYPLDGQLSPVPGAQDLVPHVRARFEALPERLNEYFKSRQPEIVVLQEVYELEQAKAVNRYFKGVGYETRWPHRLDKTRMYPAGLFIAVKGFAVEKSDFYPFGDEARAGNEKLLDNGVLLLRLREKTTDAFLLLAAVHLQALTVDKTGKALNAEEITAFKKQVSLLHGKMNAWKDAKTPAIVAGDFNVGPILGAKQYQETLTLLGLRSAFYSQKSLPTNRATWDQKNPLVAEGDFSSDPSDMVDHLLLGNELQVLDAEVVLNENLPGKPFPLSDHYGLSATVSYRPLP